jgi:hypothetical protein
MDLYETFDYLVSKLLLTDDEFEDALEGYDPLFELFGDMPQDELARFQYESDCRDFLARKLTEHRKVIHQTIRDRLAGWPAVRSKRELLKLTKEQLYMLRVRIRLAKKQLKKYPNKQIAEFYDKEKDVFFPLVCMKELLF